ncbi:MAG: hypothetical protein ACI8PZ_000351 [Myxococcota bacterium]|jgi:hypothetical protein
MSRRPDAHRLLAAFAPLLALTFASGCTLVAHQDVAHDDIVLAGAPARLVFDLGAGDMEVRVDPTRKDVSIVRTLRFTGNQPVPSARLSGTVLTLEDGCRKLQSCRVDHEVVLPASGAVIGSTGSGMLVLAGLDHRVDVDTGSGDILITDIGGEVTATTGSGSIDVQGATGGIDLDTGSGDVVATGLGGDNVIASTGSGIVRLVLTGEPRRVTIDTGSGDVDVNLPPGRYDVSTHTGSGGVSVTGVDQSPDGSRVDIETGSGDIAVRGQ